MDYCLSLVERLALKGAQDFSIIGTYTKNFRNCDEFEKALGSIGLEVNSYFHFLAVQLAFLAGSRMTCDCRVHHDS